MGVQQWCRLTQNAKCLFIISSTQCTAAVHYKLKASNWCLVGIQLTFSGFAFFFFLPGLSHTTRPTLKISNMMEHFTDKVENVWSASKVTVHLNLLMRLNLHLGLVRQKPAEKRLWHNKAAVVCEQLWIERLCSGWLKMPGWLRWNEMSTRAQRTPTDTYPSHNPFLYLAASRQCGHPFWG